MGLVDPGYLYQNRSMIPDLELAAAEKKSFECFATFMPRLSMIRTARYSIFRRVGGLICAAFVADILG